VAFVLVGDGAERAALEARAKARRLDNVRFTGRQDKALMPAFLSMSDACLVHLRDTELFRTVLPSKIFEALGMARPVIIGVPGEARRLVERAGAGLAMDPGNAAQLVEAVERLAADPELGRRLGRSGYAYVVAHHDRDRLARDYLDVLSRVLTVHSHRHAESGRGASA
jgi:glycosyltransferase involved in cell wall biosynthesis